MKNGNQEPSLDYNRQEISRQQFSDRLAAIALLTSYIQQDVDSKTVLLEHIGPASLLRGSTQLLSITFAALSKATGRSIDSLIEEIHNTLIEASHLTEQQHRQLEEMERAMTGAPTATPEQSATPS